MVTNLLANVSVNIKLLHNREQFLAYSGVDVEVAMLMGWLISPRLWSQMKYGI